MSPWKALTLLRENPKMYATPHITNLIDAIMAC